MARSLPSLRRYSIPGHLSWPSSAPYSHAVSAGDFLFVGAQAAIDPEGGMIGPGDIEAQTRAAFQNLTDVLEAAGCDWTDVVTMNTFYDEEAQGRAIEDGWVRMTNVRLEFLPRPTGPCGTGIRAKLPLDGLLIQVEVMAALPQGEAREHRKGWTRLMPQGLWDWPIPGPFTQGWRVGDFVFVGGQISRDPSFNVIGPGDLVKQAEEVGGHINRILIQAGASWPDVIRLKAFYDVEAQGGDELNSAWAALHTAERRFFGNPGPVLTVARTPLAANGLMLETEAIAVMPGVRRSHIHVSNVWREAGTSHAWQVGNLLFVGAVNARDPQGRINSSDIVEQARAMYRNLETVLHHAGTDWAHVAKLNTYYTTPDNPTILRPTYEKIAQVRATFLGEAAPVETSVRMGMTSPDVLIQTDAVAVVP